MRVMSFLFLLVVLLISCGQSYNSNSFDDQKYKKVQIDNSTPEGQRFALAYNVIKTKCISCHNGYHNSYANYTTDSAWSSSGLIVPGDFAGSFLRNKLKNFGGTMPSSGSNLTDQEVGYLEDWIVSL